MSHSVIPFPVRKTPATGIAKVPSTVRKLASSLMWTLQIPEGLALIHVIGHGDEYSNQRAIESWLMDHYTDEDIAAMASPIGTVQTALVHFLNEKYNNMEVQSC